MMKLRCTTSITAFTQPYRFPSVLSGTTPFVCYVTRRLFDCDSSQIEYLVRYQESSLAVHVSVYREDGSLLFHEPDYNIEIGSGGAGLVTLPIYNTPYGAKMILRSAASSSLPLTYAKVYSLCGLVPLYQSPLEQSNTSANAYPNPASNQITLEYRLPANIHQADLIVLDLHGKVVKQYKVTDAFQNIILDTNELPTGMYTYSIRTENGLVPAGKFIKSD